MRLIIVLALLASLNVMAQEWENFSDEDLSQNPEWQGESWKFKFSSSSAVPESMRPALQLNGSGADSAWLSLVQGEFSSMQWEFWLKLSFNSSAGNYARVFLGMDAEDPRQAIHSYYLQAGGADDSVWLVRYENSVTEYLYCLPVLCTGNSTNALRVRIIREPEGTWRFSGDPAGGNAMQDLGEISVPGPSPGIFFGLYCRFTSSNATKFYFDDIYCGPQIIDSLPPELSGIEVQAPDRLLLRFSEPVEESAAALSQNYWLTGGIGYPVTAIRQEEFSEVGLVFETGIIGGMVYNLRVSGLRDLSGNEMEVVSSDIISYIPGPADVIITEIMADPSPPAGLPEFEYLEICNRSLYVIDLTGWKLDIGANSRSFPESFILPEEYILLVDEEVIPGYTQFGRVVGLSGLSVSNDGAVILLRDTSGMIVSHAVYDPDLLGDGIKADGGWALERAGASYPCLGEEAWSVSADASGGTPGRENSFLSFTSSPMTLENICCTDSNAVRIRFSQAPDPAGLTDASLYSVDNGIGTPSAVTLADEAGYEADLMFAERLLPGILYRLDISDLHDCTGEEITAALTGKFSQPQVCEAFDLVFNEILFSPLSDGAEYIELYNRSEKTVSLDGLLLAQIRESPPNPPDTQFYDISENCRSVLPDGYAVLTRYPEKVSGSFFTPEQKVFVKMGSFPMLTNEGGKLRLMDKEHTTIDGLDYSEAMHYPLLNSYSGVALERVSPEVPGTLADNWHSASSGCGFGTPGYVNSQYREAIPPENTLEMQPEFFTPNGDGQNDVLSICCRFDEPGILLSILIFSEEGRLVRRLAEGFLAGAVNRFNWDGITDAGHRAPEGVYVILLEAVSMEGHSSRYKKAAILAYGN